MEPIYLPIPRPGHHCPVFGLSRAKVYELIRANAQNNYQPKVKSWTDRKPGRKYGNRFVLYQSMKQYLETASSKAMALEAEQNLRKATI